MESVLGIILMLALVSLGGYLVAVATKSLFFFKVFFLALAVFLETASITLFMNTDEHVDVRIIGAIVFLAVFTLWGIIICLRDYLRGQKNQTNI
jgi:predicted membrane protein